MTDQAKIQCLAGAFADVVHEWTTPEELAEIKRRNATEQYGSTSCATHDFFDANMAMDQAFRSTMGRTIDLDSDEDIDLWNAAWDMAKKGWLTAN
jgi:hypothetical protein